MQNRPSSSNQPRGYVERSNHYSELPNGSGPHMQQPPEGGEKVSIPPEVLNNAKEINSPPNFSNLQPGQHVAQMEVPSTNGGVKVIFVGVQEQQSTAQSSSAHPGDAAYYDDCVSDYSHEQSCQPTPRPAPKPARRKMSVDATGMPRVTAFDANKLRASMAPSIMSVSRRSAITRIFLPSAFGHKIAEWFQIVQVYTIKAASKGHDLSSQAKNELREAREKLRYEMEPIAARLISFGKGVFGEIDDAMSRCESAMDRKSQSTHSQRTIPAIRVIDAHNEINPDIPTVPIGLAVTNEQRRRAAQRLPRMPTQTNVARKPAPLPQHGAWTRIDVGQAVDKPLPTSKEVRRKKVANPIMEQWETQPKNVSCQPKLVASVIKHAEEIHSQRASLATASVVGGRSSRSTKSSSGPSTPKQMPTPPSSYHGSFLSQTRPNSSKTNSWADWDDDDEDSCGPCPWSNWS